MLIAPNVAVLPITAPVMGRMDTVHPVLIWDDRDMVLADTGFPGQLAQLTETADACGANLDRLNRIVLTHQDIDHIGNLQTIVEGSRSRLEVSAHPLEKPYIQGDRRLIRFTDEAIASIDRMPEHVPASFRNGLRAIMLRPPRATVDRAISGGDRLPWCGGLLVIDTPGHTPGHISFYHEPTRLLIAGDALTVRDGRLQGPDPVTTLDRAAAQASIAKLTSMEIETVVCYHGGLYRGPVRERLADIAAEEA